MQSQAEALQNYWNQVSKPIRPAGQAAACYDNNGNVCQCDPSGSGNCASSGAGTAAVGLIGSTVGAVGSTIGSAITSANALQGAQINAGTQATIAGLQLQGQQTQASTALQIAALQQPVQLVMYGVAGVVVLGIVGTVIYFATQNKAAANPRRGHRGSRRRHGR